MRAPVTDGTIVDNGTATSQYGVLGTHTYAAIGNYQIQVTVGYVAQGTASQNIPNDMVVLNHWTNAANVPGLTITEVAGQQFTAQVGTLDSGFSLEMMHVWIVWGDGTAASAATLLLNTADSTYSVLGTHTYAASGTYQIQFSGMAAPVPAGPGYATPCWMALLGTWKSIANVMDQAPVSASPVIATSKPAATTNNSTSPFSNAAASVFASIQDATSDLPLLIEPPDIGM